MKQRMMALFISLLILMPISGALAELADGIYEATAPGMNGDIAVHVAVMGGEIIKITADHGESAEVGAPAIDELIRRVMDVQDPDVDIVTGATQTSEAFVEAMKAALTQAGWEEDAFEWDIIQRWTPSPEPTPEPTPEPVAEVSAPQIVFDNAVAGDNETALVSGDFIVAHWQSEGDVQGFHLEITDEAGATIKQLDISDTQYALPRSMLAERQPYTLTVTAIPANGTLEANGVSTSARFALFVEPTPEPTPEPVLQTGEISDSWEQIIAAIDDGSARQRYAVGATKALDLGKLGLFHMQLAGFELDDRADDSGKAATTWIAVELLPEKQKMNSEPTNEGGWRDSDLRAYLHNIVIGYLPDSISNRLVRVKKEQIERDRSQITEDLLWILDYGELFGKDALYFDLFQDSREKRIKQCDGSAASWWLRSAYSNYTFTYVSSNGYYGNYGANYSYGVALGFCL